MPCEGPRFVVTGCGRSGTTYTAAVLGRLGCTAGHELVFDPDETAVPDFGGRHGDVSWAAVPVVAELPAGTVVLHQVRHPLAVIRSAVDFGLFRGPLGPSLRHDVGRWVRTLGGHRHRPPTVLAYKRMTRRFRPDIWQPHDEVARAARWWVRWNEAVEDGAAGAGLEYHRYRLEALDAPLLATLAARIGHDAGPDACGAALAAVPADTNTRRRSDGLGWDDLPPEERSAVEQLAGRYGYAADR